jgi:hypothetical protein
MRTAIVAVCLAAAVSTPARALENWQYFAAGLVGAIIINAAVNDPKNNPPPQKVVYLPAPQPAYVAPPPIVTARSKYLEACQAYGFSANYCVQIWDGKEQRTTTSLPALNLN